jgi:hypothetical protein
MAGVTRVTESFPKVTSTRDSLEEGGKMIKARQLPKQTLLTRLGKYFVSK